MSLTTPSPMTKKKTSRVDRTIHVPAPTQAEYSGFQQAFDFFNTTGHA